MIIIALGANLLTTWKDEWGSYGTVTIAIGLLFFVIGLRLKREEDKMDKN
jgi:predicted Na+-dependent transporter